ncbi:MAG: hypothetical protein ACRDUW_04980 [Pseudonocardiaceae bacterium]
MRSLFKIQGLIFTALSVTLLNRMDPTAATAKWVNNLSNSTTAIKDGVMGVQTAPGAAAAAKAATWLARIQASVDKWKTNVGAVSLGDWQQAMINVGLPRIATGAQAKQGKYASFAAKFFPYLESGVRQVKAMPKMNLNDGIQRAVFMIQHNAKFSNKQA